MFETEAKIQMKEVQKEILNKIEKTRQEMYKASEEAEAKRCQKHMEIRDYEKNHKNYKRLVGYRKLLEEYDMASDLVTSIRNPYTENEHGLLQEYINTWKMMNPRYIEIFNKIQAQEEKTDGERKISHAISSHLEDGAEIPELEWWWDSEDASIIEALEKHNITQFAFVSTCTSAVSNLFCLLKAGYKASAYERTAKPWFGTGKEEIVRGILLTK